VVRAGQITPSSVPLLSEWLAGVPASRLVDTTSERQRKNRAKTLALPIFFLKGRDALEAAGARFRLRRSDRSRARWQGGKHFRKFLDAARMARGLSSRPIRAADGSAPAVARVRSIIMLGGQTTDRRKADCGLERRTRGTILGLRARRRL